MTAFGASTSIRRAATRLLVHTPCWSIQARRFGARIVLWCDEGDEPASWAYLFDLDEAWKTALHGARELAILTDGSVVGVMPSSCAGLPCDRLATLVAPP